jgi:hypothetical protein
VCKRVRVKGREAVLSVVERERTRESAALCIKRICVECKLTGHVDVQERSGRGGGRRLASGVS